MKPHRGIYLAILMIPAIAILFALTLIIALAKFDVTTLVLIIGLVLLHYLGFALYIWKKISRP